MYKNVIFDFGNVLTRFDPAELTAACVSDAQTAAYLQNIVFDRLYWDKLDAGSMTDEEAKAAICSRLESNLHQTACDVFDRWVALLQPIAGMPEFVLDLKAQGVRLYLLSNISTGFAQRYHETPWIAELFTHFDGLVLSGPIGLTKPNSAIFEHLLQRYALQPEDCLFIDDSQTNIHGAAACGIHGYLFDGDVQKLRRTLQIPL